MKPPASAEPSRSSAIPVFLYHGLYDGGRPGAGWRERKYWLRAACFGEHLALLAGAGYSVVSLELGWQTAGKQVALSFDDGWISDYSLAWPLLQKAGCTAAFFVNTAAVGGAGRLGWNHIREMSASGARFESHSHRHQDLTCLAARTLGDELKRSKEVLESHTQRPVEYLAAPYGRVNRRVIAAALETGYRAVCTSAAHAAVAGQATVDRIPVYSGTGIGEFARLAAGNRLSYRRRRARATLLALPKFLLSALAAGPRLAGM